MENILKVAENFQLTSTEESINEKLFVEFMNKVAIWDYYAITKTHYLSFQRLKSVIKLISIM